MILVDVGVAEVNILVKWIITRNVNVVINLVTRGSFLNPDIRSGGGLWSAWE